MNNKKITILIVILIIGTFLNSGCTKNNLNEDSSERIIVGVANPASLYCRELGYELKPIINEGGEYGICLFPDRSECEEWDFYRGKCGEKWSYCKKQDYNMKNLKSHEGWFKGGVCKTKWFGREKGTVYDLMNLKTKSGGCKK